MTPLGPFQRFMGEMRRRHVPQTVAVYAVMAWAAIQFADVVVPNLGWPQGVVTGVIIAAGVGLPVVVVLAWVLEWGPEGLHRTEAESEAARAEAIGRTGEEPAARPMSYRPWFAAVTVLAVGIGVVLVVGALGGGGDVGVDGVAETEIDVEDRAMTRVHRRRALMGDSVAPEPPMPPVLFSPEYGDSLSRTLRDSVLRGLGDLDRYVNAARTVGEAFAGIEGSHPVTVFEPQDAMFGAPVTVKRGDVVRIRGVAQDTMGVVEVRFDGRVVARPGEPQPVLPFEAEVAGEGGERMRSVPIVARTRDGRELRRELRVVVLPAGG